MDVSPPDVDQTSSPQTKIALFRSLFRGRDFVLRFLAEDVGGEYDSVLDTILRALSQRRVLASTTQIIWTSKSSPA